MSPRAKKAAIIIPLVIFGINLALVYPLLQGGYTPYMASIEPARIIEAGFISTHFPYANWVPWQYFGYPFHYACPPLLPYAVAIILKLFAISPSGAYRIFTGVMYALGPVTLYFFVKYLTKRRATAIISAMAYSLLPSIFYTIFPTWVGADAAGFHDAPWRLICLTEYGEGPHIMGLTLVPLAAIAFLYCLRKPRLLSYSLAALGIAAVALTNFVALYALGVILVIILISEALLGDGKRKVKSAILAAAMGFAFSAFWLTPRWFTVSPIPTGSINVATIVPGIMVIVVALAILFIFFYKKPRFQPWVIAILGFLFFWSVVFLWVQYGIAITQQPIRFILESDMFLSFVLALVLVLIYDRLKARLALRAVRATALRATCALGCAALLICPSLPFINSAADIIRGNEDMTQTAEYHIAEWLDEHIDGYERAYLTGSPCFWLNVFTDVSQLRGTADGAATNTYWAHVKHQLNTSEGMPDVEEAGELAVLWLKAFNIKYIVVIYPEAQTPYHDYTAEALKKFDWAYDKGLIQDTGYDEDVGFRIYKVYVPAEKVEYYYDLVRVVSAEKAAKLHPIGEGREGGQKVLDLKNLTAYVEFAEKDYSSLGSCPYYSYDNPDRIVINVDAEDNAALLVKVTCDEHWRAYANGERLEITSIGPDFMLIHLNRAGSYEVHLDCGRTGDEIAGIVITMGTFSAIGGISLHRYISRRRKGLS